MLYFYLKIIHVVVGCMLFSSGFGGACFIIFAHRKRCIQLEYKALCANWSISWFVMLPLGIVQALLGFSIIAVKGYSPNDLWILVTYVGFFAAAILWVVSLYFQMQCKDILKVSLNISSVRSYPYEHNFKLWLLFGSLTVVVLLVMIFFMANQIGLT